MRVYALLLGIALTTAYGAAAELAVRAELARQVLHDQRVLAGQRSGIVEVAEA